MGRPSYTLWLWLSNSDINAQHIDATYFNLHSTGMASVKCLSQRHHHLYICHHHLLFWYYTTGCHSWMQRQHFTLVYHHFFLTDTAVILGNCLPRQWQPTWTMIFIHISAPHDTCLHSILTVVVIFQSSIAVPISGHYDCWPSSPPLSYSSNVSYVYFDACCHHQKHNHCHLAISCQTPSAPLYWRFSLYESSLGSSTK